MGGGRAQNLWFAMNDSKARFPRLCVFDHDLLSADTLLLPPVTTRLPTLALSVSATFAYLLLVVTIKHVSWICNTRHAITNTDTALWRIPVNTCPCSADVRIRSDETLVPGLRS